VIRLSFAEGVLRDRAELDARIASCCAINERALWARLHPASAAIAGLFSAS
jgi:hypothetical protein